MSFRPAIMSVPLTLALLLSACVSPSTESSAAFTERDVTFLQEMVPHHSQAVEMAGLVADRTAHGDELGELADSIVAAQEEEIQIMDDVLSEAGEDSGTASEMSMDSDSMAMSMSPEDMSNLQAADGGAFDALFLDMMIVHHSSAIESAQEVLDAGDGDTRVAGLAEDIIDGQQAELEQMRSWQEEWDL